MEPVQDVGNIPLDCWAQHAHKYPLFAQVARSVLAVLASSAPSERVFSQAGLVMSSKRSRLAPDHLETIIFLKGSWEAADRFVRGSCSN